MHETLTVKSFSGLTALEQFAPDLDALNLSSARPNPFLSTDFLRCFSQYNEYGLGSEGIRLYTVWAQEQLIGCLPLRWMEDRFGPLRASRLCYLVPFDIEQPDLLCAAGQEQAVAQAIIHHLCTSEPRLGMLELIGQHPGGALHQAMHQAHARFRVRDIEVDPYNEITIAWPDLAAYFRSLSPKMRSNVARCARQLFAAGTPQIVFAEGPQATSAWFDAYLDLESRSWKHNSAAAIVRNADRARLYRQLMTGQGGFAPSFIGVLIDGVLMAGDLNGSLPNAPAHARGMWALETAFDASYAHLSPGQLLPLLDMHAAIQRQEKFINLLNGFAYYKKRWNAEIIPTAKVQLIRRWSLYSLRGTLGDLKRLLQRKAAWILDPVIRKPAPETTDSSSPPAPPTDRTQARSITAQALAYAGPGIQRLDYAQIAALLPFDIRPSK